MPKAEGNGFTPELALAYVSLLTIQQILETALNNLKQSMQVKL